MNQNLSALGGTFVETIVQGSQFGSLAVVFVVLALAAYVLGARGIAGVSMRIAYILILIFIVLAIVSMLI